MKPMTAVLLAVAIVAGVLAPLPPFRQVPMQSSPFRARETSAALHRTLRLRKSPHPR